MKTKRVVLIMPTGDQRILQADTVMDRYGVVKLTNVTQIEPDGDEMPPFSVLYLSGCFVGVVDDETE